MLYPFEFAAHVTRLCMDEIRRRGLEERKILRKSAPSSVLFLKVFREQCCTADDLTHVSIHSVATLMQDTLWCSPERIVPKSVWRTINYETCTLSSLSKFLTPKGEQLLIEILDFLVEVMQHKEKNLMDAYHLGEAMGKVTLGPADCDPIIAEKANHFMTRMIIEHSKRIHSERKKQWLSRVDSGFARSTCSSTSTASSSSGEYEHSTKYYELYPMSKMEATRAKAKSYDRLIRKIHRAHSDWASNTIGIRSMLDNDYEPEPSEPEEPWISIFTTQLNQYDPAASPLLYRIVSEASKPKVPIPADPFASSYLFRKDTGFESQIHHAFSEFAPLCIPSYDPSSSASGDRDGRLAAFSHLRKINHSLSHMKLNLRKPRSHSNFSSEETIKEEDAKEEEQYVKISKQKHVRSMMKKVIKKKKSSLIVS